MAGKIFAWLGWLLLALLYTTTVVAGVGNLVGVPQLAENMGLGITAVGWFWLWFGALMPVAVFAISVFLARRRGAGVRLLVLAAGLCLVAAVQLEVLHLVPQSSFFM